MENREDDVQCVAGGKLLSLDRTPYAARHGTRQISPQKQNLALRIVPHPKRHIVRRQEYDHVNLWSPNKNRGLSRRRGIWG